jgi:hypothetical protein
MFSFGQNTVALIANLQTQTVDFVPLHAAAVCIFGAFPKSLLQGQSLLNLLPLLRASGCAFFQSRLGLAPFPKAMFGFPLPLPFTSDQHGHFLFLLLLQMGWGPCLLLGLFVLGCLHLLFLFLLPFHQPVVPTSAHCCKPLKLQFLWVS